MKIKIDSSLCLGHSMCTVPAAALIDIDPQTGQAVPRQDEVPVELEAAARMAQAGCPEQAIILETL